MTVLLSLLFLCVLTTATYAAEPIASYRFDGDCVDSSGHGHTCTLLGGAQANGAPISGGQSLILTPKGARAVVPATPAMQVQTWSLAAWINMTQMDTGGCVWSGVGRPFGGFLTPSGKATCYVQGSGGYVELVSATAVVDGQDHHLGCTYDGQTLRSYVAGVEIGHAATVQKFSYQTTDSLTIGGYPPGGPYMCLGRLDDLHVYASALTAQEMSVLAQPFVPPAPAGPVLMVSQTSPAINAANCVAAVTTDILDVPRPQGVQCDMGAYEVAQAECVCPCPCTCPCTAKVPTP